MYVYFPNTNRFVIRNIFFAFCSFVLLTNWYLTASNSPVFFCLISIVTFSVTYSVTVSVSVSPLLFRVRVDLFNFSLEYLWMWRQYRNTFTSNPSWNLIEFGPDPEEKRPKIYSRKVRNDFVLLKTRKSSVHAYCFRNANWFQKT